MPQTTTTLPPAWWAARPIAADPGVTRCLGCAWLFPTQSRVGLRICADCRPSRPTVGKDEPNASKHQEISDDG